VSVCGPFGEEAVVSFPALRRVAGPQIVVGAVDGDDATYTGLVKTVGGVFYDDVA
jgi:hypothetical protein